MHRKRDNERTGASPPLRSRCNSMTTSRGKPGALIFARNWIDGGPYSFSTLLFVTFLILSARSFRDMLHRGRQAVDRCGV